jgi:hypothetical protein
MKSWLKLFRSSRIPRVFNPRMRRTRNKLVEPQGREYRGLSAFGSLFLAALLISLILPQSVRAETKSLQATKDTFANEAYKDSNYASATITVSNEPINRFGFLDFEWFDLPVGAEIDRATFKFYVFEKPAYTDTAKIDVGPIKDSWEENTLTWNNHPQVYQEYAKTYSTDLATGWKEVDVTDIYKKWVSAEIHPYGIFVYPSGFLFGPTVPNFYFTMKSKDTGPNVPQLVIEYHAQPTSTPEPTATPTKKITTTPSPEETETPTETPVETPTETPQPTPAGGILGGFSSNQKIIAGAIGLALIAAAIAFAAYGSRKPKGAKPTPEPKTGPEAEPETPKEKEEENLE